MIIGWHVGYDNWAFENLVSHLIKALPQFEHKLNSEGDINVLLTPLQLKEFKVDSKTILHVDGNRWYENH